MAVLHLKYTGIKLLAFERFLQMYPHRAGRTLLLVYGIVPDARPDDHVKCRAEVERLVTRSNAAFPSAVKLEVATRGDAKYTRPSARTDPKRTCTEWCRVLPNGRMALVHARMVLLHARMR